MYTPMSHPHSDPDAIKGMHHMLKQRTKTQVLGKAHSWEGKKEEEETGNEQTKSQSESQRRTGMAQGHRGQKETFRTGEGSQGNVCITVIGGL